MAVHRFHLDEEGEQILRELTERTGLSISDLFSQGLVALRDKRQAVSQALDLGPSNEQRKGV